MSEDNYFNKSSLIGKTLDEGLISIENTKYHYIGVTTERGKYFLPNTDQENPTIYVVMKDNLISSIIPTLF